MPALRAATGPPTNADLPVDKIKAAREFFTSKGADLAPPKSLFYSERWALSWFGRS